MNLGHVHDRDLGLYLVATTNVNPISTNGGRDDGTDY